MIDEKLVREITELVVKRLQAFQSKALVVYTDTVIGAEDTLKALQELKSQGFAFDVLMSRKSYEIQDINEICSVLEPENFWVEPKREQVEIRSSQYDVVLVPALTVSDAARIAACIADTPDTAVVLDAFMRGKKVVISIDGCCPEHLAAVDEEIRMPEPLKKKLQANLEVLSGFGASLTESTQFKETTLRLLRPEGRVFPSPHKSTEERLSNFSEMLGQKVEKIFSRKLLSVADIADYEENGTLWVRPGTMITQLAKDEARKKAIEIEIHT